MARPSPMPDGIRVHVRCAEVRLIRVFASIKARHTVNPYEQQWLTAQAASEATLLVDDVWVRYVVLGGAADAVAVAAYLHGIVLLDVLHRDLVSYAVNELLQTQPATRQFPVFPDSGSSPAVRRRAPYADESGPARNSVGRTTHTATTLQGRTPPVSIADEHWLGAVGERGTLRSPHATSAEDVRRKFGDDHLPRGGQSGRQIRRGARPR
jgi:hypothetical protein